MAATVIPTPAAGDVVLSSWGAQVAAAHNGIQTGQATLTMTAQNGITAAIVFPRPYASPPAVFTCLLFGQGTWITSVDSITTTGAVIRVSHKDTGNFTATLPVQWIAVGVPA